MASPLNESASLYNLKILQFGWLNLTPYSIIESFWLAGNSRIWKLCLIHHDQHTRITDGFLLLQGIKAHVKEFPDWGVAAKMETSTNCFYRRRKEPGIGARIMEEWTREKWGKKEQENRKSQKESKERIFSIKICQKRQRCQQDSHIQVVLERICHN